MLGRVPIKEKQEALRLAREVGVPEAARRTGHPKGTVYSWARQQGVTPATPERGPKTKPKPEWEQGKELALREAVQRFLDARWGLQEMREAIDELAAMVGPER